MVCRLADAPHAADIGHVPAVSWSSTQQHSPWLTSTPTVAMRLLKLV